MKQYVLLQIVPVEWAMRCPVCFSISMASNQSEFPCSLFIIQNQLLQFGEVLLGE